MLICLVPCSAGKDKSSIGNFGKGAGGDSLIPSHIGDLDMIRVREAEKVIELDEATYGRMIVDEVRPLALCTFHCCGWHPAPASNECFVIDSLCPFHISLPQTHARLRKLMLLVFLFLSWRLAAVLCEPRCSSSPSDSVV